MVSGRFLLATFVLALCAGLPRVALGADESGTTPYLLQVEAVQKDFAQKVRRMERLRRGPTYLELVIAKYDRITRLPAADVDPELISFHAGMLGLAKQCNEAEEELRRLEDVMQVADFAASLRALLVEEKLRAPKAQVELLKKYADRLVTNMVEQERLEAQWGRIQSKWRRTPLDDGRTLGSILGRDTHEPLSLDLLRLKIPPSTGTVDPEATVQCLAYAVTARSGYLAALEAPLAKQAIVMEDARSEVVRMSLYTIRHHQQLSTAGVDPRVVKWLQNEVRIAQDMVTSVLGQTAVSMAVLSRGARVEMSELVGGVFTAEAISVSPQESLRQLEANNRYLRTCVEGLSRDWPEHKDDFWEAAKGQRPREW